MKNSKTNKKLVKFTCPSCRRKNETNNTNKNQPCHTCGEALELEIKRNGRGKNSNIQVLSVRLRKVRETK